jgi:ABC-type dipeptide/oligopeptide/nickel transport system permease component
VSFTDVLRRLFLIPPTLLGVLTITFFLLQIIPGNPVERMVGERGITMEQKANLIKQYGLDRPVWERFSIYLNNLAHGNFGTIPGTGRSVLTEFMDRLPNTVKLALAAFMLSVLIGLPAGIISGYKPGSMTDILLRGLSTLCQSTPVFWFGLAVMYLFAYKFRIFPPSGSGNGDLRYLILPALTLGVRPAAFLQRIVRSSLLEVMNLDYIRTARAKGLSEFSVLIIHGLRNAIVPVVTLMAVDFGLLLSGSVITESVFHYRGIGSFILYGIQNRIYSVVLLTTLFTTALFMAINLLTDIFYVIANPRLRNAG